MIFKTLINPKVMIAIAVALIVAATRGRNPVCLIALNFVSRPTPAMLIAIKKAEHVWATTGRLYCGSAAPVETTGWENGP